MGITGKFFIGAPEVFIFSISNRAINQFGVNHANRCSSRAPRPRKPSAGPGALPTTRRFALTDVCFLHRVNLMAIVGMIGAAVSWLLLFATLAVQILHG